MNSVNNCTISFQIFNLKGNKIYLTHSILFEGKYTGKKMEVLYKSANLKF